MSDDLTAWLRVQAEARLRLAREAADGTDGHWWRRTHDLYGTGEAVPVGPLYGGEPLADEDGEVTGGEFTVVYDEGSPSGAEFEHMEANDPQDVIARCEAELAILNEHSTKVYKGLGGGVGGDDYWCETCDIPGDHPGKTWCRTVRLLGTGYARRPGYREEWRVSPTAS